MIGTSRITYKNMDIVTKGLFKDLTPADVAEDDYYTDPVNTTQCVHQVYIQIVGEEGADHSAPVGAFSVEVSLDAVHWYPNWDEFSMPSGESNIYIENEWTSAYFRMKVAKGAITGGKFTGTVFGN